MGLAAFNRLRREQARQDDPPNQAAEKVDTKKLSAKEEKAAKKALAAQAAAQVEAQELAETQAAELLISTKESLVAKGVEFDELATQEELQALLDAEA